MIGCGDSYCAALAARSFMMDATGAWSSRSRRSSSRATSSPTFPADSFVFGVSNSGTVSRTIEGVQLARERGAWTFAVTVSAANRLAETAETLVKVNATPNIKERPDGTRVVTPGTVTYTASMLGLFLAGDRARRAASATSSAKRSQALVDELRRLPDAMAAADESRHAPIVAEIAASFTPDRKTVILGGGPNYATAYFGMAKWHEALTRPCHTSELEEWAHEEYFITDEKTDTFILLPPGGGREPRARAGGGGAGDGLARHHHRRATDDEEARAGGGHLFRDAARRSRAADAVRLQAAFRTPFLPDRATSRRSRSSASTTRSGSRSTSARSSTRPKAAKDGGKTHERAAVSLIRAGAKAGDRHGAARRRLPGSSRYRGGAIDEILRRRA